MNDLERGREAYGRRAWGDAYHALLSADQAAPLEVQDLERLATAAYLAGRELEFQRILERLYRLHVESGDGARAARCTFWLAISFLLRGENGRSNAWTARGQRLVEAHDCVERGYLAVVVAEHELGEGRGAAAQATAAQAAARGESCRDADLAAAARHTQGRALIQQGDVVGGLKCLDETMLAVVGSELSPIMTGLMYCSVIDTCRRVYALGRAREWTAAFSRVCEEQPEMGAFTGICLVHRAEILQLQGAWPEALSEACLACERARRADRKPPGAALYQQAEIHRLCGQFAKAEDAYRAASELGFEPQPGLALLRLGQGRTEAACAAMRRLISATSDPVRRAGLLPAHLEIMLASGDLEEARRTRDELRALAAAFDTDWLRAIVAQADGAIASAEGHAHDALDRLRCAFDLWERLEAPYEAARVRVLIARACRALGDDESAGLEIAAARSVFERLGARPALVRLAAPEAPASRSPLTARELRVLRLVSTGRTNKQIAGELGLSERTVDRHVTNILTKLEVRSRTAATAYAYDHKLL
jgi:DNA-binding CsgD family transcriptional regulator/tetratricopeptide (TPR) repeat protein